MQKTNKPNFKTTITNRIFPTLFIAFVIPFIVCICIPLEIFGNNLDEFLFSTAGFLPTSLLFCLLFTLVFFLILLFLPQKAYRIACAVLIALGFMCFLQGTYLNMGLTSLSGDNLGDKVITIGQKILNLIVWIVVVALAVFLALQKDKNGLIGTISLLLCGIVILTQAMGPVMLCLTEDKLFKSKEDRIQASQTAKASQILTFDGLTNISSVNNVFYFCVDRFDQSYVLKAQADCPEIFDSLKGFTAFYDNVSLYGHTFPAVTNMLTEKRFDETTSREEYLNTAYQNNNTLDVLNQNGYSVNLYTQPYYAYTDASYLPTYISNVSNAISYEVTNKPILALSMMQIALYRCFPLFLKQYVGNINSDTCNSYVESEGANGFSQYSIDMKEVYKHVTTTQFNTINQKLFSFIHLAGCHAVDYNLNWNKPNARESKDILISLKNSFKIINVYINALKNAGVYDNSTIIITGDHSAPINDRLQLNESRLTALFFKPSNSFNNDLNISLSQVSHDDVWNTIFYSENLPCDNVNLFNIGNENRTREYVWHTYKMPMEKYVYQINGNANYFDNWTLTNKSIFNKFIMD